MRILLLVFCLWLFLALSLIFGTRIPLVQRLVTTQVNKTIHAQVNRQSGIQRLQINFPYRLSAGGIYLEDNLGDTLLYSEELVVDLEWTALLRKRINLEQVSLHGTRARLITDDSGAFNFEFLVPPPDDLDEDSPASESAWTFSGEAVSLRDIHFSLEDPTIQMVSQVKELDLEIDALDLPNERIVIANIEGAAMHYDLSMSNSGDADRADNSMGTLADVDSSTATSWTLSIHDTQLEDVHASLYSRQAFDIKVDGQRVVLEEVELAIAPQDLQVQLIQIVDTQARLENLQPLDTLSDDDSQPSKAAVAVPLAGGWNIEIDEVELRDDAFHYVDPSLGPETIGPLRLADLQLLDISMELEALQWSDYQQRFDLKKLQVMTGENINLQNLQMTMEADPDGLVIDTLVLVSEGLDVHFAIVAKSGQKSWIEDPIGAKITGLAADLKLNPTIVSAFDPSLAKWVKQFWPVPEVQLSINLRGDQREIVLNQLTISAPDRRLSASASLRDFDDPATASGIWQIDTLWVMTKDWPSWNDSTTLLPFPLPDRLAMRAKGNVNKGKSATDLAIAGDDLEASINYQMLGWTKDGMDSLSLEFDVHKLPLDRFLRKDILGAAEIEGHIRAKQPLDDRRSVEVAIDLPEIFINDTLYQQIGLAANYDDSVLVATIHSLDTALHFMINGHWDMSSELMRVNADITNFDLQKMGLVDSSYSVSGEVTADLDGYSSKHRLLDLEFRDLHTHTTNNAYQIDSLVAKLEVDSLYTSLRMRSDLLTADYEGNVQPSDIQPTILSHFDQYDQFREDSLLDLSQRFFKFELTFLRYDWLPSTLLAQFESVQLDKIGIQFRGDKNLLIGDVQIPHIAASGAAIDSIDLTLNSQDGILNYHLLVDQMSYAEDISLSGLSLRGGVNPQMGDFEFTIADSTNSPRYQIRATAAIEDDSLAIRLQENKMVINRQSWSLPEGHLLWRTPDGWFSRQFQLTHDDERVSIETHGNPEIHFSNFSITNLTSLPDRLDTVYSFDGGLNGLVTVPLLTDSLRQLTDLSIRDLTWNDYPAGDLQFDLNYDTTQYNFIVGYEYEQNDLQLRGQYANEDGNTNFEVHGNIQMKALEDYASLAQGQVLDLRGKILGQLDLSYQNEKWDGDGQITLREVHGLLPKTGLGILFQEEVVSLDRNGLQFQDFTIRNHLDHQLNLNGYLALMSNNQLQWDLQAATEQFRLLDNEEADDIPVNGIFSIRADSKVTGNVNDAEINGDIGILKDTDLTIELPGSELELIDEKGVVEWIDYDNIEDTVVLQSISMLDSLRPSIPGISIETKLTLSSEARFKVLVNPQSGDQLNIQGEAELFYTQDRLGSQSLSGRYEVTQGSYELYFYGLVKKKFKITPGGSISWSGDPDQGVADLQAVFETEGSPEKLLSSEAGALSDGERASLQRRLPFQVELNIDGSLTAPEIGFDLDMPARYRDNNPLISSKLERLSQPDSESERYQQVFALLVLGDFVPTESGANGSGSFATTAARNSINGILTQQLNNLTDRYVKGIDIDVGINSYDATQGRGIRTEVDVQVSTQLFDERLTLEVGSRFDVEGNQNTAYSKNSGIPEYAVIYQLTPGGNYRIKAFREEAWDIVDGQVQDTGLAFIFIKDFGPSVSEDRKKRTKKEKKKAESKNSKIPPP